MAPARKPSRKNYSNLGAEELSSRYPSRFTARIRLRYNLETPDGETLSLALISFLPVYPRIRLLLVQPPHLTIGFFSWRFFQYPGSPSGYSLHRSVFSTCPTLEVCGSVAPSVRHPTLLSYPSHRRAYTPTGFSPLNTHKGSFQPYWLVNQATSPRRSSRNILHW